MSGQGGALGFRICRFDRVAIFDQAAVNGGEGPISALSHGALAELFGLLAVPKPRIVNGPRQGFPAHVQQLPGLDVAQSDLVFGVEILEGPVSALAVGGDHNRPPQIKVQRRWR